MLPVNSKHDMNRVNPDLETDKAYLEFAEPSATMASTTASLASKTRESQQVFIHASHCKLNYLIGIDDKNQTAHGMYYKKLPQQIYKIIQNSNTSITKLLMEPMSHFNNIKAMIYES